MDLASLRSMMMTHGVTRLYAKKLAPNDNSKNQIYLGPDFSALNILPIGGLVSEPDKPHFKAAVRFSWLGQNGQLSPAPHAQLILYPQYPEVRFSGFLRSSEDAPTKLLTSRDPGRVLFVGTTMDGRVIGHAAGNESSLANEFLALQGLTLAGIFSEVPLSRRQADSKDQLLRELGRIHQLHWIRSKRLGRTGAIETCESPNCGGYTLEAELGIKPNGVSEPDYLGWEIKQHSVKKFGNPSVGVLTLMTPEPNGGVYKSNGVEAFVRRYGYPDMRGRPDRLNFGGIHRYGQENARTKLTLRTLGYDEAAGRITDPQGGIALVDASGNEAAVWRFDGLIRHWNRKHRQAAYVPSLMKTEPAREYRYGQTVRLGDGTDFLLFLKSFATGVIYYDPGIKLEKASSSRPESKRRSQFRIKSADLGTLYQSFTPANVIF